MNDELNEDLEEYVDRLVRWRIRQRSREVERALDNPSEVHVYDRPEAVVVAPASAKAAKGIAHQQPDDDDEEPPHLRQTPRRGRPKSSPRALENNNGRYPEDRR